MFEAVQLSSPRGVLLEVVDLALRVRDYLPFPRGVIWVREPWIFVTAPLSSPRGLLLEVVDLASGVPNCATVVSQSPGDAMARGVVDPAFGAVAHFQAPQCPRSAS